MYARCRNCHKIYHMYHMLHWQMVFFCCKTNSFQRFMDQCKSLQAIIVISFFIKSIILLQRSNSSSSSKSENVNDNHDVNGWRGWGRRYGTTFNLYFFSYAWTSLSTVCFPKLQQIDFPLSWQRPIWLFQYFTIRLFLLLHTFFFQTRLEIDLCPVVPIRVNEGV